MRKRPSNESPKPVRIKSFGSFFLVSQLISAVALTETVSFDDFKYGGKPSQP